MVQGADYVIGNEVVTVPQRCILFTYSAVYRLL